MESRIKTILVALLVFWLLNTGIAAAFSVDLTTPNTPIFQVMPYATVLGYVDGGDDSIFHFEIDLAQGLSTTLNGDDKNFGMDQFVFNTDLALTESMFTNFDPSIWGIQKLYGSQNTSGFGTFSVWLKSSPNNSRSIYLDFEINYTSTVTEDNFKLSSTYNAGNGNGDFAAQIGGFDLNDDGIDDDDQSVWVRNSAPIPEPGTMVLLGISLITVAGYMRRIDRKE